MENREALNRVIEKYKKLMDTPYMPVDEVRGMVRTFERFINQMDVTPAIAFGVKLADAEGYVKRYMEENDLTAPKDETEAKDRALALVGAGLTGLHRTLQQNFARVVLAFIEMQAAKYEAGLFDLRNEDTCRLSYTMWSVIKDRQDLYLRMV